MWSGAIQHKGMDERGDEDLDLLVDADQGYSESQNDLGILCLEQERADIALYWFSLAVDQGHADVMHFLSEMYQQGNGVVRSETTALL